MVPADKVLLMTDGVYARLDEAELNSILSRPSVSVKNKIDELFDMSNSRGNLDSQSCMILEF